MSIEGANGKYLPAIEVFSKAIEYIKKHALDHLRENGVPYPEAATKWVLTVPAIWPDPSKSVMRAAAEQVLNVFSFLDGHQNNKCVIMFFKCFAIVLDNNLK